MQIRTVVSPLLGAACHVVGEVGGPALLVDPGQGVVAEVLDVVSSAALEVHGVLVTHGHVDHTWSAGELCAALGVPLHVHEADLPRIADPFGTLGPLGAQLAQMAGGLQDYREPDDVRAFTADEDEVVLELGGGLTLTAMHCPGHTQGSTVYRLDAVVDGRTGPTALTGDVLFAGSVGRTDLPGGADRPMGRTLRRLAALDPATVVLPGHGPSSTIGHEVAHNPYLSAASPFFRDA